MRNHRYLWALAAALLASCADYSVPDSVLYGAAVYTQPAPGFNPAGKGLSYYLDPQYTEVDGETQTQVALPGQLVTAITTQMESVYGYTRIDTGDQLADLAAADVGIKTTVLKGNVNVYYPGYWCDYWYYYSCYYGGAYYAGSYNVGTFVIELGDLSAFPPSQPDEKLPVLWTGLVYGVASTGQVNLQRAVEGTNRAFGQSTYLKTN